MFDHFLSSVPKKAFLCLLQLLLFTFLMTGCVTASSTRSQLYSQTQQNRSLLRIEQQRSRNLIANRASLQRELDEKYRKRDMLQIQDTPSQESRQEIARIKSEIAKLKQSILESTE